MTEASRFLAAIGHLSQSCKLKISLIGDVNELRALAVRLGYGFTVEELSDQLKQTISEKQAGLNWIDTTNFPVHFSEEITGLNYLSSLVLRQLN